MVDRARTATSMAFRDQLRRPLVLILLVIVPSFVVARSIATTLDTPRQVGLPGGLEIATTDVGHQYPAILEPQRGRWVELDGNVLSGNGAATVVKAFSPAIFALLVDQFGWQTSLYALLGCSLATWAAIELMSRWYERAQLRANDRPATRA